MYFISSASHIFGNNCEELENTIKEHRRLLGLLEENFNKMYAARMDFEAKINQTTDEAADYIST